MIKNSDPALYKSFMTARECHAQGDLAGAEAIYSRLLALDPADDELLYLFGHLQVSKGAIDVGLECLNMARQLKPSNPTIPYSIGVVLQNAGRLQEAIQAYRSALAVDAHFREALENLCAACYDSEDYESGLDAARQALALDSTSLRAIRGAANCYTALGRRAEALEVLGRGIEAHPALPALRIHHAWELMANGYYAEGWKALEWRNSDPDAINAAPRLVPWPRWNGESLAGKTILVYGEQGIGDEIMYAPFVGGITRAGGHCILECEPRLERLFAKAFPECELQTRESVEQIAWRADLPAIDYCISALSLPIYFPPDKAPFLFAPSERVSYWRERLHKAGPGLKVGVSWRGGMDPKARRIRSIPPEIFGSLIEPAMTFVSLQYGANEDEIRSVSNHLVHFPEVDAIRDFDEFVALVAALDVVVSVDNSTVHLAGALGVRTLVLLPVYSEWRWGDAVSGESPWYETVEMVRQSQANIEGWQEVLEKARAWLSHSEPADVGPEIGPGRAVVLHPNAIGRSALIVGDMLCWHHWGYSAASLGLHAQLREHFNVIDAVPAERFLKMATTLPAANAACLDSEEFFARFESVCPDIVAKVRAADCVIVDAGLWAEAPAAVALLTLYVGYVAVRRFGKRGVLLNATPLLNGDRAWQDFHDQACRVLDVVALDAASLRHYKPLAASVRSGFDSLLRFWLDTKAEISAPHQNKKFVLAGVTFDSPKNAASLLALSGWMRHEGYAVEFLLGCRGPLAVREVQSVEEFAKALRDAGLPSEVRFCLSEREWFESIASAALLVSGDFHHLLAAALQSVPFLIPVKPGVGQAGLFEDLGIEEKAVAMTGDSKADIEKARVLLSDGAVEIPPARWVELNTRFGQNFTAL